ncbi:MAG: V-type ATP synthase subunit C [Methanomicrobiales archaeon]
MVESITAIVTSLGFSSIESFLGLIFLVGAVIGVIVVIVTIKPVLDTFPYAYPNARVRARIGRLFTEKQFSEIIEAEGIEEVKNYLRGVTEYAQYVDKFPLEKALDSQLAETYDVVARIAPGKIKPVFRALLKKWDIRNIKSLLTAKEVGLSREETLDLMVPFGEITELLEKLIDAKDVIEVVTGLEGTEFAQVLEDSLNDYKDMDMLLPLEAALDKYYLDNLMKAVANPSDDSTTILNSYIGTQVDSTNLKIILRAKVDGLKYDDIQPYMVKKGYQIREWKLKDLMEAEDVAGVISSLESTDYANIMAEALSEYNATGSLEPFELALDKHVVSLAKDLSTKKPFGVGPIIAFISRKEIEIKNLKVIARGKREIGFPVSKIKEMLI